MEKTKFITCAYTYTYTYMNAHTHTHMRAYILIRALLTYMYNVHAQVDLEGTGVVAYENAATLIPDLLLQIFALRVQQSMVRIYISIQP